MAPLLLGVRLTLNNFVREKIDDMNFDKTTVDELKARLSSFPSISLEKDKIELVYCGNVLQKNVPLSDHGVKPGHMIHVLKKREKDEPKPVRKMTESEAETLVVLFLALTLSPNCRNKLEKAIRPEVIENIIAITPGLKEDPVAITFIQDPELLVRLADMDTVKKVINLHPALADAANHIITAVNEHSLADTTSPPSTTGYSYSLAALSDDEEMDSSQSSDSQVTPSSSSRQNITSAQLAAALSVAAERTSTSTSQSSGEITPAMVTQAVQQAIHPLLSESSNSQINNLETQLQQMIELGLTDTVVNIQALQVTNGDVHSAVELILSGALSSDS